ncbi:MAG: hypothetical protein DWQ04_28245 [Chloroflexi bacterium]|nr:MAG: hypothetical protein DWQ04_28245 [Chloroflexota bacterium]
MTTQKGEIVKWFENKRFGFIQPENTQGRDAQVFLHQSHASLPANKLKEGTVVEFETIRTDKGLNARNVRLPGGAAQSWPKGYRFLNPYNFVRSLPYRKMAEDAPFDVQLMGRTMPPTHDRWLGLSGTIECQFETITPLFVSDAEAVNIEKNISEKKKHYSYRFFRLNGKKAVPATSLRGMIRSVFEAATNSTFSNLGGERLSYRLPSNEVQKLVPARVEKTQGNDTNAFVLRLLPGTAPFAPDFGQKKGLYAAPARFYKALKPTGKYRRNPPSPIRNADDFDHGLPYFAVLREMKFPPSWRVVALFADKAAAEKERSAIASRQQGKFIVQSGWLCKTNQNSDNKNSERFFFRDQSRKDVPETIPLPPKERDKFEALIRDYQTRHKVASAARQPSGLPV